MIFKLLSHQWKQALRSPLWQKNLAISIVYGFFIVYMLVILLFLGFVLDKMLVGIFDDDPIILLSKGLLYYFGLDMLLRLYLQELPVLSAQPYLHLPIKKSTLSNYVLSKSLFALFNFLPLILLIPFSLKAGIHGYTASEIFPWFLGIIFMILFNNYFVLYIKRLTSFHPALILIAFAIIAGLMLLDYHDYISFSYLSYLLFGNMLKQSWLALLPLAALALANYLNYRLLHNSAYIEEGKGKKKIAATGDIPWLARFGEAGQLIGLQYRLILRHKRPRSVLYMSGIFVLYGLIIYTQDQLATSTFFSVFVAIITTGMFMISYGQFLLSWEGSYFDGLLSKNISGYEYFRSKYLLFVGTTLIAYVLTIPYVYFGVNILLMHTAAMLYNIGVNAFIVLFFATIDPKRIDLSKSSAFNWQGVNSAQFLLSFPLFLIPFAIYLPFTFFAGELWGIAALGAVGFINLIFYKFWLNKMLERLQSRKYKIAENFREQ